MFKMHHIDVWINKKEDSIKFYQALGFEKVTEFNGEDKNIILMKLNNFLLELKYHNTNSCIHNSTKCGDNKVFGLSVENIYEAKSLIETKKLTREHIKIEDGILGQKYFLIHDPNGILIEFIEEK